MPLVRFRLRSKSNFLLSLVKQPVGFTLVETLVALAIVSLVVLGGMKLFRVTTDSLREAQIRGLALGCADHEAVRVSVSPLLQTPGIREIGCRQGRELFQVTVNVAGTPHQNFRRLTIRVKQQAPLILAERVMFLPVGF